MASQQPANANNVGGVPRPISRPLMKIFKIIVVGDSNVGKTCLTYRFVTGHFPKKVDATVGVDFREKTVELANPATNAAQLLRLQLWDSAGQERFRASMVPHYYRNVHAAVFVYDVGNLASFESLTHWIDEYDKHSTCIDGFEVPRVIVGNKTDIQENHRQVSTYVAQQFADTHGMPLFETSALLDSKTDHVDAIFMTIAHKLMQHKSMSTGLPGAGPPTFGQLGGVRLEESSTKETSSGCSC